jgi:signal recognition particle GTPase
MHKSDYSKAEKTLRNAIILDSNNIKSSAVFSKLNYSLIEMDLGSETLDEIIN